MTKLYLKQIRKYENKQQKPMNKNLQTTTHLAIFKQPFLNAMLDGKKTIESRFMVNRSIPYKKIHSGDKVIIKESCGLVIGEFKVKKVEDIELNSLEKVEYCKSFSNEICSDLDKNFWKNRENKRYATLIWIDSLTKYNEPRECTEKPNRSMAGWFVLKNKENK